MTHTPNHDLLLDQVVTALKQKGLDHVALTLLEVGRPLVFLGSQLLWLAQPALGLLWPSLRVQPLAKLMEDPTSVDTLMLRLAADKVAL